MGKRPKQADLPLDAPARVEPVLTPPDEPAAPAAAAAAVPTPDRIDDLLLQIFKITGQKFTRDDPVVVAALLQASLLDDAAQSVAGTLQQRSDAASAAMTAAIAASQRHVETVDRAMARAQAQIADGIHAVSEQELIALRASFARTAAETLDHIRRNVLKRSGWRHWWRDPAGCCVGLAFGLTVGTITTLAVTYGPSREDIRLMHNGMLLDAAWPQLPHSQRMLISSADRNAPVPDPVIRKP